MGVSYKISKNEQIHRGNSKKNCNIFLSQIFYGVSGDLKFTINFRFFINMCLCVCVFMYTIEKDIILSVMHMNVSLRSTSPQQLLFIKTCENRNPMILDDSKEIYDLKRHRNHQYDKNSYPFKKASHHTNDRFLTSSVQPILSVFAWSEPA